MKTSDTKYNPFFGNDDNAEKILSSIRRLDSFPLKVEPFNLDSLKGLPWVNDSFSYSFEGKNHFLSTIKLTLFFFKHFYDDFSVSIIAQDYYEKLMDDYVVRFSHQYGDSIYVLFNDLIIWKKLLISIANETSSILDASTKDEWKSYPLCHAIELSILGHFESIVFIKSNFAPFEKNSPMILYNVWGDDYDSSLKAHKYLPLTEQEIAMVDYSNNKKYFFDLVSRASEGDETINVSDLLQTSFKDYIRRVYQCSTRIEVIRLASEFWKEVTISELSLARDFKKDLYIEFGSELDTTLHLYNECIYSICKICDYYLDNLEKKHGVTDWSLVLSPLKINYKRLYDEMNNRFFSGIDFTHFHDAFISADFSAIIDSARARGERSGCVGIIQQLVKDIGGLAGDEWYQVAASSITNEKDGKNAVRKIGKLKLNSQKNKAFEIELVACIGKLRK